MVYIIVCNVQIKLNLSGFVGWGVVLRFGIFFLKGGRFCLSNTIHRKTLKGLVELSKVVCIFIWGYTLVIIQGSR